MAGGTSFPVVAVGAAAPPDAPAVDELGSQIVGADRSFSVLLASHLAGLRRTVLVEHERLLSEAVSTHTESLLEDRLRPLKAQLETTQTRAAEAEQLESRVASLAQESQTRAAEAEQLESRVASLAQENENLRQQLADANLHSSQAFSGLQLTQLTYSTNTDATVVMPSAFPGSSTSSWRKATGSRPPSGMQQRPVSVGMDGFGSPRMRSDMDGCTGSAEGATDAASALHRDALSDCFHSVEIGRFSSAAPAPPQGKCTEQQHTRSMSPCLEASAGIEPAFESMAADIAPESATGQQILGAPWSMSPCLEASTGIETAFESMAVDIAPESAPGQQTFGAPCSLAIEAFPQTAPPCPAPCSSIEPPSSQQVGLTAPCDLQSVDPDKVATMVDDSEQPAFRDAQPVLQTWPTAASQPIEAPASCDDPVYLCSVSPAADHVPDQSDSTSPDETRTLDPGIWSGAPDLVPLDVFNADPTAAVPPQPLASQAVAALSPGSQTAEPETVPLPLAEPSVASLDLPLVASHADLPPARGAATTLATHSEEAATSVVQAAEGVSAAVAPHAVADVVDELAQARAVAESSGARPCPPGTGRPLPVTPRAPQKAAAAVRSLWGGAEGRGASPSRTDAESGTPTPGLRLAPLPHPPASGSGSIVQELRRARLAAGRGRSSSHGARQPCTSA